MNIRIEKIVRGNLKQLSKFIDFPHQLYKDDPCYVPALYLSEKELLTKHPFHQHSEMALFLAYKDEQPVGRIAAILNNNHNSFNRKKDGFFGFFDTINDLNVARSLINYAEKWLKDRYAQTIIGPVNPSTNDMCGMLIEGVQEPPAVMMSYNASYYPVLMERLGFVKNTDLLAHIIHTATLNDKTTRVMDVLNERLNKKNIRIRKINLKKIDTEIQAIKEVYNRAWDKNLGFVPMTDAEFLQMGKDMKLIVDGDFCLVAEHNGKAVGFALCLPDINQIQIKLKKGRLFPFGIFKLLKGKKKVTKMRVLALGIVEDYRKMGIEAVFIGTIIRNGISKGIMETEASWILEENTLMNRAIENVGGKIYKRYRIFEKPITL